MLVNVELMLWVLFDTFRFLNISIINCESYYFFIRRRKRSTIAIDVDIYDNNVEGKLRNGGGQQLVAVDVS
jgi:hypothetical protein